METNMGLKAMVRSIKWKRREGQERLGEVGVEEGDQE